MIKKKVLFILKSREEPFSKNEEITSKKQLSSGLFNSANFVNTFLQSSEEFESKLVHVNDNNCIDREVYLYRPDIVIIEAYWVVPEKFEILQKLHPKVKWIIRNHSEVAFLANEGIAFDWSIRYVNYDNVYLSCNAKQTYLDFVNILENVYVDKKDIKNKVLYLPNTYPIDFCGISTKQKESLDISCFGAIRPLKNHMVQVIAAIRFANMLNMSLNFHINDGRIEMKGDNILKNIKSVFNKCSRHKLIEHDWMDHSKFKKVIKNIDIGLQVSYTETFNIVAADHVSSGVPVVASNNVPWLLGDFPYYENDSTLIADKLFDVYNNKESYLIHQQNRLKGWNDNSENIWKQILSNI